MEKASTVFEIGGEKFDVVKSGLAQANQIAGISRWLSAYAAPAYRNFTSTSDALSAGVEVFSAVLSALSTDALLELFMVLFGCSKQFAVDNFDMLILFDGVESFYNNSPIMTKLVRRFFTVSPSSITTNQSSTPSEKHTDGKTKRS